MRHFIENIKVDGNVGDIFALPCINAVHKVEGAPVYELGYVTDVDSGQLTKHARPGDWLCRDDNGKWYLVSADKHPNT